MKTFVRAIPVKDIIIDLSKQFHVPIEEMGGEFTILLPKNLGKGFIRGSSFDSGLGIIEYHCTFFKDMEIHFNLNQTHPLKFVFCSKGRIKHTFEKDDIEHTLHTYQNMIISSSGQNGHVLYFKGNETSHVFSLEIIREIFGKRNDYKFQELDVMLKKVFLDSHADKHFFHQGNYSIMAADIVDEVNSANYAGFLRNIFMEGKAFEILVNQIAQFHDDQREDKLPQMLRRSDVEKVESTVELIKKDLGSNYSVEYLAKEAGTNVNKLQDGFKYMFNLTVNKYIQQVKLEASKELLSKSEHNISQIVGMIGLNNRSYFSKIFKEKYGVSPKYFLNTRNKNAMG